VSVVVDASVIVDLLSGDLATDSRVMLEAELIAPELLFAEVTSAIARLRRLGVIADTEAFEWVTALEDLPIEALPQRPLAARSLELSDRLSVYDACYVALAEREGAILLTADRKLARSHDLPVEVRVV
jgi:predicted nucleic acid-binding protein